MRKFHVNRLAPAALLVMAMLWGSTLVVLKDLLPTIGSLDLTFERFAIATLALLVMAPKALRMDRRTLLGGIAVGSIFGVGMLLATTGLATVDASVSGFLTGLYVVFTPILGWLVFGKRVPAIVWASVGLSTVGIAVLSLRGGGHGLGMGEVLTLLSAVMFAAHIIATSKVVTPNNAVSLSLVQAATIAVISGAIAVPNGVTLPHGATMWAELLYLAVICGSIPLLAQIWAQAHVEPTRAAVIMGTEPVWAAGFAVLLGGESMTLRLLLGGLVICAAIYLVVKPQGRRRGSEKAPAGRGASAHLAESLEASTAA